MHEEYKKLYSADEVKIVKQLDKLFKEWKALVKERDDGYWFIPDGFYPNYLKQSPRILYIGRDAHDLYGEDDEKGEVTYIEKFLPQYLSGLMGDAGTNINRAKFHKMLIQVAYGIIHEADWNQGVLPASEICGNDNEVFSRVSFAFMNLCKWSHEYESGADWAADWTALNDFVEKSISEEKNFFPRRDFLVVP